MPSTILKFALIGSAALALCAPALLAQDSLDGPALSGSSTPDAHEEGSENIDAHEEGPGSLDARTTGPSRMVEADAESPDDLEASSENIDDHEGSSTALQDLPDAGQQEAAVEAETMHEVRQRLQRERAAAAAERPAHEATSTRGHQMESQIASVHAAKQALAAAKQRAAAADAAYGDMMQRDYPRGEARLQIVDERKLAHQAVQQAEQRYDAALNGGGPASR